MSSRFKKVVVASAFAGFLAPFTAQAVDWTGLGADSNWSTKENWSSAVPVDGKDVNLKETADGADGNTVIVDVDSATLNSLTYTGAQNYLLTTETGKGVTVSGDVAIKGNSLDHGLSIGCRLTIGGKFYVGCSTAAPGAVTVLDGADITVPRLLIGGKYWGDSDRHGAVYQRGGSVTVTENHDEAFKLGFAGGSSSGYYELTGGTLTVPVFGSVMSGSTGEVLLNGGTLGINASRTKFFENFNGNYVHLKIGANGGTIDTGIQTVIMNYAVESGVAEGTDGGLVKAGSGLLQFTKAPGWTGPLTVKGGTVELPSAPVNKQITVKILTSVETPIRFSGEAVDLSDYTMTVDISQVDVGGVMTLWEGVSVAPTYTLVGEAPEGYSVTDNGDGTVTILSATHTTGTYVWQGVNSDFFDAQNWKVNDLDALSAPAAGDTVVFNDAGAATTTVTLAEDVTVSGLEFTGETAYTLGGVGKVTIDRNDKLVFSTSADTTIGVAIDIPAGSLVRNDGTGKVTFSGSPNFSGWTKTGAGEIVFREDQALTDNLFVGGG